MFWKSRFSRFGFFSVFWTWRPQFWSDFQKVGLVLSGRPNAMYIGQNWLCRCLSAEWKHAEKCLISLVQAVFTTVAYNYVWANGGVIYRYSKYMCINHHQTNRWILQYNFFLLVEFHKGWFIRRCTELFGRKTSQVTFLCSYTHVHLEWPAIAQTATPMSLKTGFQSVNASISNFSWFLFEADCALPHNIPSSGNWY